MYQNLERWGLLCCALLALCPSNAQQTDEQRTRVSLKDGITVAKDTLFEFNLRFRIQDRFGFTTVSGDDLHIQTVDARVRRCRLRFDGFVLDKRLRYYLHLGFSKADMDLEIGTVPQVIRDAIIMYQVHPNFQFALGQTKLPGNRQRYTSSGNQQFPDLSIANAVFNLDRDYGLFATWTIPAGQQLLLAKGALTTGDGRGASPGGPGMSYTGRLDWLPFGAFTNKGDYSEGDLEMEPRPKVSFGAVYSYNDRAVRVGGQLGPALYAERDIHTAIADFLLKYNGWAFNAEYFDRKCSDPITTNDVGSTRAVIVGQGFNTQFSKYFRSKYEIATRYTLVSPGQQMGAFAKRTEEVLLGATKYIKGHRIKLQHYVGYRWFQGHVGLDGAGNAWTTMFQIEFGI